MSDWQLLRQFVETRSQEAFAELVRRHSAWVRAAARRQVRDEHLADDVAQAVFLALARQAHRINQRAALSTWLFQVTRYAASSSLRARSRRALHERQAAMTQSADAPSMSNEQWKELSPMLDACVARLRKSDQRAVLLRFYEQKSYRNMAAALGVSEEAARKRTDRAIEKLRRMFAGRGVTLSAGVLSAGLMARTADAAPLTMEPNPPAHIAGITNGALHMMTVAKLKVAVAIAACAVLLLTGAMTMLRAESPRAAATTAPATQPLEVDETTPKGVILAAFRAANAGDAQALMDRFTSVSPQHEALLRDLAALMQAAHELNEAISAHFGADMERQLAQVTGAGVLDADIAFASEAIAGDNAVVDIGAGPGRIALVRSGQVWKISPAVLDKLNPRAVRQFATRIPQMEQLTAAIRAGEFESVEQLQRDLARMMGRGGNEDR